ncbi:hypothetical protein V5O48_013425 [Marasmius crinis-equi]|uniref:GST N-terminal domain-containing protein n=1 Tax=Marasmius crinis-equi TaxID=585013 RepID=A0ABR3F042_9AGAR
MISLYDLGPTAYPVGLGTSPHVRKIIFTLNYKQIPFKIEVLDVDDLEDTAKAVGAPHTSILANGQPRYTVPFIKDHSTGKAISDSIVIAEYLDQAYPDTPKVFPDGTCVLQSVFMNYTGQKVKMLSPMILPKFDDLVPGFIDGRRKKYGGGPESPYPERPKLSEEQTKEMWGRAKASFAELEGAYGKEELWVIGDRPVYADFVLSVVFVTMMIAFGEESEEWKNVRGWAGGRIGRLVDGVLKYRSVD